MKEYIDKHELQQAMSRCETEWEQLMIIPSWFNAEGVIELQPTITEAEIRNKAIDDCISLIERKEWHDVLELPQILQGLKELKEVE